MSDTIWFSGFNAPVSIIIYNNNMYVVSSGYINKISMIEEPPSLSTDWEASGLNNFSSLAIYGNYIYASNNDTGNIHKISLNDSSDNTIWKSDFTDLGSIVIEGNNMYVSNNNNINIINMITGTNDLWATNTSGRLLYMIIKDDYMYATYFFSTTILRIKMSSPHNIENFYTSDLGNLMGLVIYGSTLLVTNMDANRLIQLSLSGMVINNIALSDGLYPTGIALYQSSAYIASFNGVIIKFDFSDICFIGSTPINTDQGIVTIEMIDPTLHTINGKVIQGITKTTTTAKYLVCFEKNALGLNRPNQKTIMTLGHSVMYGKMTLAKKFLGYNKKVNRVKYNGEILYNILMEDYSTVIVNNMICETLDPSNVMAKNLCMR